MAKEYRLGQKEIDALVKQSRTVRFEYLAKRVADWGQLWVLTDTKGDVMSADDEGRLYVPIWPFKPYAELCAIRNWANAKPRAVRVNAFLKDIKELIKDNIGVAVFPTPTDGGAAVEPEKFREAILYERSQF